MEQTARLGGRAAWWALILVSLTQGASLLDRQILAILVPRIKADLHVGDAEMGMLYGTVFALFYALFSLPLGRLADGWVRTRLLGIAILGWSAMTGLAGFANSFGMLVLTRLGVGIGEASAQPAGFSLLSDRFPRSRKGTFTAVMAAGTNLGLGGALWFGGSIAGWWEHHWAAGAAPLGLRGWQAAFLFAALPGPILALFLFGLKEPVRGAADGIPQAPDPHPFRASWSILAGVLPGLVWINFARRGATRAMWLINIAVLAGVILAAILLTQWTNAMRPANPVALQIGPLALGGNAVQWIVTGAGSYILLCWVQSLRLIDRPAHAIVTGTPALLLTLGIAALQMMLNYGIQGWSVNFAIRTFSADPATVGLQFGLLTGGMGIIGPLISGPLSDAVARRVPGGRIYVTLAALTISPILAQFVYRADSLASFYFWFVPYSLALTMWLPPIYAAVLDLVLPRMRGAAMSLYLLVITIFGMGIGPYTVGLVSDGNGGRLGPAILSIYWVAPLIVVMIILLIRIMPRDEASLLERARAAGEPI